MTPYYEKVYALHNFDFNAHKHVKTVTLLNFLQDISTCHYNAVVGGNAENAVWVIVEWDVHFRAPITKVQTLTVKTKPTYFRKFIAYRAYEIVDESGVVVVTAVSKWAYINYETRKQMVIPKTLYEVFDVPENADKPLKLEHMDFKIELIEPMSFRSCFSDIDINQHVNNVSYLRWGIDSLPYEFIAKSSPKRLQVYYKKEIFINDVVRVLTDLMEKETRQMIQNSNSEECVKIRMLWK
ncbi:acyl-[acyl-carrier-protein] thioesterase [Fusibacter sp. 3D3]|uniref:acyl-[acyl-carrier-protein] thioesterase n=1 Tax=Fusibacter sp. 3D3 TaxID=1048380 RepID=UPI00085353BF|nr:acyl-ACP thioesterase domain-containing protein [Fusibacter sp. 3D3]GAU77635.1 acyl-ACP thioesterase [Fusibacter sp. 3D3]